MPRTPAQNEEIRQARTEQILEAARQVFAEQGFYKTRMSDIAQAIGVSQGTLYHYFRSKDELFMALLSIWVERLAELVKGLPDTSMGAADKLRMMNQVGLDFLKADQALLPVLVEFWAYALRNPEAKTSFRCLLQTMQQSVIAIINEGITNGEFASVEVEAMSAVPMVVLDGTIILYLLAGEDLVPPAQLFDMILRLVLNVLQPQGALS